MQYYELSATYSKGGKMLSVEVMNKFFESIAEEVKKRTNDNSKRLIIDGNMFKSLTGVASGLVVRPLVVVSDKLKYMEQSKFKQVIEMDLKIFTAFYIQVFRLLAAVHGLQPTETIRIMNKGRVDLNDIDSFTGVRRYAKTILANESMTFTYDILSDNDNVEIPLVPGFEAKKDGDKNNKKEELVKHFKMSEINDTPVNRLEQMFVNSYDITIEFRYTGDSNGSDTEEKKGAVTIPVIVYPVIVFVEPESFIRSIIDEGLDDSLKSRWEQYKAGAITLADLIFAIDLIKKYKEKKIKNQNDIARMIKGVNKSTFVSKILTGEARFADKYNIYIFDRSDLRYMEEELRGKIIDGRRYNEKNKEILLSKMSAFSLTLVDNEQELVIVFIKDIPGMNVLPFDLLKKSGKNDDIADIFKNLLMNKSPF